MSFENANVHSKQKAKRKKTFSNENMHSDRLKFKTGRKLKAMTKFDVDGNIVNEKYFSYELIHSQFIVEILLFFL